MTIALENVLAKAGLHADAGEFLALVEDAANKLAPLSPEPELYFSEYERGVLSAVGLDLSAQKASEADFRARTIAVHAVFANSALSVNTAARKLGIDPSRVRHRLAQRRLTGWKDQGEWRLPAWQFTETAVLPGLEIVLTALPADQPALAMAGFMGTRQADLVIDGQPTTPRHWLLAGGDPKAVARLAATLGSPS